MTLTVTHCAEDALAAGVSAALLDRVVRERSPDWLADLWAPETIGEHRAVVDLEGREGWSDRSHVRRLQERELPGRRFRAHPRDPRTGRPLRGNAALAYDCVRLAAVVGGEAPRVLLLAYDTDGRGEAERCAAGVAAAEAGRALDFGVVVAEAHPEFDAWVIAGFEPGATHEKVRLGAVVGELKFDPREAPHRLTSTVDGATTDAKALCARLLGLDAQAAPDDERVTRCVCDTALEVLVACGEEAGVAAYVDEVRRVVLPLLGAGSGR